MLSVVALLSNNVHVRVMQLLVGLLSEKIQIFVSASLALKLRIYTQNTPIRRNPSSEFRKKNFLTVIF